VQRGGAPSAFDRNLGTIMGHGAVEALVAGAAEEESQVIGMRGNRVVRIPLAECVSKTREINRLLESHNYAKALELRGTSFNTALRSLQTSLVGVAQAPLSAGDLAAIREFARQEQFDLIWLPGLRPEETNHFSRVPGDPYYQTFAGLLTAPLRDRFGIVQRLEFYSAEELTRIVRRSAQILGIQCAPEPWRPIRL